MAKAQAVREETYKQALLKARTTIRELLEENAALRKKEPIAVVGMACRFPSGANSPEQFWTLLRDGIDAITDVPPSRWTAETYYASDHDAPGKMYTVRGGFLDTPVGDFDASFFGISPREARALDPQHRLLLEISWEALEHACLDHTRLKDSKRECSWACPAMTMPKPTAIRGSPNASTHTPRWAPRSARLWDAYLTR